MVTIAARMLRWVMIIATGYLLLFFHPIGSRRPVVGVFLAAYLASNFVFAALLRRVKRPRILEMAIVLFDSSAISVALLLAQSGSSDFFLLYFFVIFLATLSERVELVELPRHGYQSFCCGAGGAQMWKEEEHGQERVSANRFNEAQASGAGTVAVGCPFCMVMLNDARKDANSDLQVLDIAEIVAERLATS